MCIRNDRSQGAEDRGWNLNLLSIRLKAKAEDKINERGRGGDDIIEDEERVDQKEQCIQKERNKE